MGSQVINREVAAAIDAVGAGLDALFAAGLDAVDARDAVVLVREVEGLVRRARAAAVGVQDGVDRAGWHRVDGHASAKVMVRHVARLCDAEAGRRMRDVKALRDLPELASAYRAGTVGSCQVDRIGRLHANPRVSAKVAAQDRALVKAACELSYREFDLKVSEWERLVDADGAGDRAQDHDDQRDATMVQDYDGRWRFAGSCGSLAGAELFEIFKAFFDVETLADWEQARAEHGDAATGEHLARSDGQRRFDAWHAIANRAAGARAADPGGSQVVTNIVIDEASFSDQLRRFTGLDPDPGAGAGDPVVDAEPGTRLRCGTIDGHHVDPTEAVAAALIGHVRRVVINSAGTVIDLGRRSRVFTGPAQLAVRLSNTECYWPGCHVPVSDCQIDHLKPWGTPTPRHHVPRKRRTRLRAPQPVQAPTRLHRLARPHRPLAHPQTRRHRTRMKPSAATRAPWLPWRGCSSRKSSSSWPFGPMASWRAASDRSRRWRWVSRVHWWPSWPSTATWI